jgi:hypothetical protein
MTPRRAERGTVRDVHVTRGTTAIVSYSQRIRHIR